MASQPVCGKSTLSIYQHLLYAESQRKCFYLGDERDAQSQDVQFKDGVSHPHVRACLNSDAITGARAASSLQMPRLASFPALAGQSAPTRDAGRQPGLQVDVGGAEERHAQRAAGLGNAQDAQLQEYKQAVNTRRQQLKHCHKCQEPRNTLERASAWAWRRNI